MAWSPPALERRSGSLRQAGDYATTRFHHLRDGTFWICYDHDDDCRRAIGSPLTIWIGYRPSEFRLTRGILRSFSKTKGVTRTFCPECGTSVSYFDEGICDELYVTIGFFDHPERFPPQAHAYWQMKLPWVNFDDSLPHVAGYSRSRDPALGNPVDR
jgi:hypothetical protein